MTMKKKLAVTTLSASILLASLAGLPLSEKGFADKLGISVGVASADTVATTTAVTPLGMLNGLHGELVKDVQGLSDVKATRDYVAAHNFTDSEMQTILGPVWTKLAPAGVNVTPVFALFNSLDLFYDESGNNIDALVQNTNIRAAINTLFTYKSLPGINDQYGLSKQSVIDFQEAAIAALKSKKNDLLASVLVALSNSGSTQDILNTVNSIVKAELSDDNLLIYNFLKAYHITLDDLNVVQDNIANAVGAKALSARAALVSAGVRYVLAGDIAYVPTTVTTNSVKPGLTVFGSNLINNYLTWSLQTGTVDHVKFTNDGTLVLDGANAGSGKIQARDSKFGLLLYISATISLNNSSSTDPGTGTSPADTKKDPAEQGKADLDKLIKDLVGATDEKKSEIFKKAQDAIKNAIAQLATLDLKSSIKVEGNVAKPTLNNADLTKKMKEVADKAKALNDQLQKLNPQAKPEKVELKLDFGTTTAKTTEIPFAKELLDSAKENGIDTVSVSMNGLTLGVSPTEFSKDTTLKVSKQDKTEATDVTKLNVVSDVFNFEFTSGGNEIHTFNKPVTLQLPIENTSNVDTDLLTLAKIINGKLEYYGGSYQNGTFSAKRNGFSTYTVVENKVSFGDTTSVKAWAGRQIQVAAAKGILEGRAEQTFDPNGFVTRAEFAKMIVKTFSLQDDQATENFADVSDSDWYKVYVASAVKNGIVNGKEAGKFDPNGKITRAEMAVMSSRALALKGVTLNPAKVDEVLKGFTDATAINTSLKDGVALAANEGIIIGEEGNAFNPNANSTRAQAAVVIYRLLNK
ncbi:S-layer homology domain-containing protein [Paenibacillus roseipurpureus]|uniref:S-layer homology domain-containing protein n=1 Tax=Paenibacillus roseopurpureus TaxID=2918901 RepID=A0AA96RJP5_9BACL|nr:S-layer homology domain-containing protein [Paenibacillus sp. MBLB1832]WNR43519.1 S-layer homology domain-containing protein [Paenibacillus sp. MBLB1832]